MPTPFNFYLFLPSYSNVSPTLESYLISFLLIFTVWPNFYSFHCSLSCCGISSVFTFLSMVSFLCPCDVTNSTNMCPVNFSIPFTILGFPLFLCHLNIRGILENFHYPFPLTVHSTPEHSGMFHFSHPFPIPLLIPWGILPYFYPLKQYFSDRYSTLLEDYT